jgi:predicted MPP superfamily phosphohydrolase
LLCITLFFAIVFSLFLLLVILQYILIRVILPQSMSGLKRGVISSLATLAINMIPLLYMGADPILDQLPWWHRKLILFPYAIFMVASAFSAVCLVILWCTRSIWLGLWPRFEKTKRDFLSHAARTITGASIGALAYGTYHENQALETSRVTLPYKGLHPDLLGFRIVQVTDIHAGPFISFDTVSKVVSTANALKPDLIVLTGDYVNDNPAYISGCLGLLNDLRAPTGVFGVYGNHDYYTGISAMRAGFSKTHIAMLTDSRRTAKGLEGLVNIMGVDDPMRGWASDAQFENVADIAALADRNQFNLLLSHRPGIFRVSKALKVDLTLAGHTHGGQIIVPGVGERGLSLARLFLTYTNGLYAADEDSQVRMYVSRGIGTIIAPVRLFCKPEIVEFTLTRG